jgi:hypothetical protein
MTLGTLQIILEVIIFIIGLYLAFFKSYFHEKGKNVATKEDIEEITEKVEKIKNQISFSTQSRLSLNTEKRNAIVNCFEKYNFWQNTIVDISTSGIYEENKAKLKDFETKMGEAYFHFELSYARMNLFLSDVEMTKSISNLKVVTMELQHIIERHLDKINLWIFNWSRATAYSGMVDTKSDTERLHKEREELTKTFREEKMEKYKDVIKFTGEFQIHAYRHIQALTKHEEER